MNILHIFKQAWDLVKEDVHNAVDHSFHKKKLLNDVNYTAISLVCKVLQSFKEGSA